MKRFTFEQLFEESQLSFEAAVAKYGANTCLRQCNVSPDPEGHPRLEWRDKERLERAEVPEWQELWLCIIPGHLLCPWDGDFQAGYLTRDSDLYRAISSRLRQWDQAGIVVCRLLESGTVSY